MPRVNCASCPPSFTANVMNMCICLRNGSVAFIRFPKELATFPKLRALTLTPVASLSFGKKFSKYYMQRVKGKT